MSEAQAVLDRIRRVPGVEGTVVWRIGSAPVGNLGETANAPAPGLLSAGVGSIEHVVEVAGLGQIEELWFLTDSWQCLVIRLGEWQAIVTAGLSTDIEKLRDQITELLEAPS